MSSYLKNIIRRNFNLLDTVRPRARGMYEPVTEMGRKPAISYDHAGLHETKQDNIENEVATNKSPSVSFTEKNRKVYYSPPVGLQDFKNHFKEQKNISPNTIHYNDHSNKRKNPVPATLSSRPIESKSVQQPTRSASTERESIIIPKVKFIESDKRISEPLPNQDLPKPSSLQPPVRDDSQKDRLPPSPTTDLNDSTLASLSNNSEVRPNAKQYESVDKNRQILEPGLFAEKIKPLPSSDTYDLTRRGRQDSHSRRSSEAVPIHNAQKPPAKQQETESTIHVHIGSVIIRANHPSVQNPQTKKPSRPVMSLDEYLNKRSGGNNR